MDSTEKVREIFERAVNAIGLHALKGSLIWDTYREFEMAMLEAMQTDINGSDANLDPNAGAAVTDQMNRIHKIFKRQLSLPIDGIKDTYEEYKRFIAGDIL